MSDIDTAVVDSLKVLDPKRPIREADINRRGWLNLAASDSFNICRRRYGRLAKFIAN